MGQHRIHPTTTRCELSETIQISKKAISPVGSAPRISQEDSVLGQLVIAIERKPSILFGSHDQLISYDNET